MRAGATGWQRRRRWKRCARPGGGRAASDRSAAAARASIKLQRRSRGRSLGNRAAQAVARRTHHRRFALRLRVTHRLDVPPGVRQPRPGAPGAGASSIAGRRSTMDALSWPPFFFSVALSDWRWAPERFPVPPISRSLFESLPLRPQTSKQPYARRTVRSRGGSMTSKTFGRLYLASRRSTKPIRSSVVAFAPGLSAHLA